MFSANRVGSVAIRPERENHQEPHQERRDGCEGSDRVPPAAPSAAHVEPESRPRSWAIWRLWSTAISVSMMPRAIPDPGHHIGQRVHPPLSSSMRIVVALSKTGCCSAVIAAAAAITARK
jgi:hypothetical protein